MGREVEEEEMKPIPEELRYWKSGTSTPDVWINKTIRILEEYGAVFHYKAFGKDGDKKAYVMEFSIGGERFKLVWPVLIPQKEKDMLAAQRQAATMLHHDIKARLMYATVHGTRNAFLPMLLVPDSSGRLLAMGEIATPELKDRIPKMLSSGI